MKPKSFLYILPTIVAIAFTLLSFQNPTKNESFTETVKVVLRDIGNKLLLANHDSTSLVLPVKKLSADRYELTFQNKLYITPDSLVAITNRSLKTANLPKRFIVEVLNCDSKLVSYSFKINNSVDKDIVPCLGRDLPTDCYSINVLFLKDTALSNSKNKYLLIGGLILILLLVVLFYKKRTNKEKTINTSAVYTKIGNYNFYEDQNKLVKDAIEIKLSSKECELINMFSLNQNQVIKRDVLIKEIWEDNGVFVGRSLDTFISKLRKKFKDDDSINIVNVHGVGYKLEVD